MMEEYCRAGQEKLQKMVQLHHDTIVHLIELLKKKEEKEADFWNSLQKDLKEVKQENGKS